MKILEFPLSRITFSFVFGVLFSHFVEMKPVFSWLFLIGSFLVFLIVFFSATKKLNFENVIISRILADLIQLVIRVYYVYKYYYGSKNIE